jgi:YjbE family integral membrane protein
MSYTSPELWVALLQIIGVNIVLSGDNAVVIALAARGLPADQQKRAVAWGSGAAVVMRIALTIVAVELLRLPYLKLVGAALLVWIAIQLLIPEDESEGHDSAGTSLAAAIKTILLADLVMSLDNVIGVAAAAKGNVTMLILGLAISIPLVIFASRLLLTLMERFPIIITLGAGLLGWVAGDMAITDPAVKDWVDAQAAFLHVAAPALGAVSVVLLGRWLAARSQAARPAPEAEPAARPPGQLHRVLLAADGSAGSEHAARQLVALRQAMRHGDTQEVHLVNVHRPMTSDVARFVTEQNLDDYHRERSDAAFGPVRPILDAAGISYQEHRRSGDPGQTIAELAHELGCDLIIMGTRGLGKHTAGLIGSVAQGTVASANVPVMLVK